VGVERRGATRVAAAAALPLSLAAAAAAAAAMAAAALVSLSRDWGNGDESPRQPSTTGHADPQQW
jgi:hypothetical protein